MNPIRLSVMGTALFLVTGVIATIDVDRPQVFVAVSLMEFAVGTVVFAWAFLRAVGRSRTETIGIGGLFFAAGSAPRPVQTVLIGSFVVQTVAAIVFASIRLYTSVAFGVLAPMWSLGFTGLWVASHGTFPPREPEPTRAAQRAATRGRHDAAPSPAPAPRSEEDAG